MTQKSKDRLFDELGAGKAPFRFDERVAQVFPDMINRSVPGYGLMLEMIRVLTSRYAIPKTRLYDLGCSLGASTLAMRHALPDKNYTLIGVDNSEAMIERCRINVQRDTHPAPVSLLCDDLTTVDIRQASVVTMNFTLQFIARAKRRELLERISHGLIAGGALILSEKLDFDSPEENQRLRDLHHDFKRSQGYTDLEISEKRNALEDVLVPETFDVHRERLLAAGFSSVTLWFQCFNFCSILAIR